MPEEQHKKIKATAMDMGAPFILGTRQAAPRADVVHDCFHVSKPLNETVDQTRREELARLAVEGDGTLKRTRYLWLHGQMPED